MRTDVLREKLGLAKDQPLLHGQTSEKVQRQATTMKVLSRRDVQPTEAAVGASGGGETDPILVPTVQEYESCAGFLYRELAQATEEHAPEAKVRMKRNRLRASTSGALRGSEADSRAGSPSSASSALGVSEREGYDDLDFLISLDPARRAGVVAAVGMSDAAAAKRFVDKLGSSSDGRLIKAPGPKRHRYTLEEEEVDRRMWKGAADAGWTIGVVCRDAAPRAPEVR